MIFSDGRIWKVDVVESSGSGSLDAAATAAFQGGFIRPFPAGTPDVDIELSLHYVLAHRRDQPAVAGYQPVFSKKPFTIANDPVKSPILDTMLQRTCTGTIVQQGIRNHPWYGTRHWAKAIFFRRPDGTPWVKFYEDGYPTLAPVIEVGRIVQWTGREEHLRGGTSRFKTYSVWPEGENTLSGSIQMGYAADSRDNSDINRGGTVDFTCAADVVPAITWSSISVTSGLSPIGDPP